MAQCRSDALPMWGLWDPCFPGRGVPPRSTPARWKIYPLSAGSIMERKINMLSARSIVKRKINFWGP